MCLFAEQGIREAEELEKVRKGKGIYREELDGLWGNGRMGFGFARGVVVSTLLINRVVTRSDNSVTVRAFACGPGFSL